MTLILNIELEILRKNGQLLVDDSTTEDTVEKSREIDTTLQRNYVGDVSLGKYSDGR